MPQKDHNAGELNETEVVLGVIFIADDHAAEVVQPGEQSFHFPATLKAAQRTSVLSDTLGPATLTMWSDHLGAELLQNFTVQPVTVVSLISNESLRDVSNESLLQCLSDQFYFSWASTVCAY